MIVKLTRFQNSFLQAPMIGAIAYVVFSLLAWLLLNLLKLPNLIDSELFEAFFGLGILCAMGIVIIPALIITLPLIYGISWLGTLLTLPLILILRKKTTTLLPYIAVGMLGGYMLGLIGSTLIPASQLSKGAPLYLLANRFAYILPGVSYMTAVWFLGVRAKNNKKCS